SGVQPPLLTEKQCREKGCHLSPIAHRRRDKRRDGAIQIDTIPSLSLWLGPKHQFEKFDVFPEILVVTRCLNPDVRRPVQYAASQLKVIAGEQACRRPLRSCISEKI